MRKSIKVSIIRAHFTFALFVLLGALGAKADDYLRALPDLPLAPGLSETEDATFIFDKPEGRILQVAAATSVPSGQVADFYRATLPNLGWQMHTGQPLTFTREGEILRISLHDDLVIFDLAPDKASKHE